MQPIDNDKFKELMKRLMENLTNEMNKEDSLEDTVDNKQERDENHPFKPKNHIFHISFQFRPPQKHPEKIGQIKSKKKEIFTDIFDRGSELMVVLEIPSIQSEKQLEIETSMMELHITGPNFQKSVELPKLVNENSVKTRFQNGILEITLTKQISEQPKPKIPIE